MQVVSVRYQSKRDWTTAWGPDTLRLAEWAGGVRVREDLRRHPPIAVHLRPNLTASSFVGSPTDLMVTRRATLKLKSELCGSVILALMRYVAPGASDGVR